MRGEGKERKSKIAKERESTCARRVHIDQQPPGVLAHHHPHDLRKHTPQRENSKLQSRGGTTGESARFGT